MPQISFSDASKAGFVLNFVKYSEGRHFTVKVDEILEFCARHSGNLE